MNRNGPAAHRVAAAQDGCRSRELPVRSGGRSDEREGDRGLRDAEPGASGRHDGVQRGAGEVRHAARRRWTEGQFGGRGVSYLNTVGTTSGIITANADASGGQVSDNSSPGSSLGSGVATVILRGTGTNTTGNATATGNTAAAPIIIPVTRPLFMLPKRR